MKNLDYSYKTYRRISILLFIAIVLLFNIKDAFAQFPILRSEQKKKTFFYVQTKYWSSDENVWRKPNGDNIQRYYTFTDYNCFDSDANGYPPSNGGLVYNYYGRKDGMIYYRYYDLQWLIVSEDYKIVTTILEFKNGSSSHEVFEMRDPSSIKKFPNISPQQKSSSNSSGPSSYGGSGSSYGGSYNSGVSKTCTFCHGTGLRPSSGHESAVRYSTNRSYTYCNRCGSTHLVLDRHENCGVCQGTGRVIE